MEGGGTKPHTGMSEVGAADAGVGERGRIFPDVGV